VGIRCSEEANVVKDAVGPWSRQSFGLAGMSRAGGLLLLACPEPRLPSLDPDRSRRWLRIYVGPQGRHSRDDGLGRARGARSGTPSPGPNCRMAFDRQVIGR